MAKAIERIERDIAALEEATSAIAEELSKTYERYLIALGQAMRQQLILASYHLCTQGYPEAFLSLSFSQRQNLQQEILKLAQNAKQQLFAKFNPPNLAKLEYLPPDLSPKTEISEQSIGIIWENALKAEKLEEEATQTQENDLPAEKAIAPLPNQLENKLSKPEKLMLWQEQLESAIAKTLQKLSRDTNLFLQKSGILPKKLPEPVLEAAAKVEAAGESMPGPPNLLNLVIETESDPESQISSITHLIAIHLRLSEIEFAEPAVAAARHQIRHLYGKLSNLRREYQKKQRERAVAEAEIAWRASWFED